jgi:hypothetical protein
MLCEARAEVAYSLPRVQVGQQHLHCKIKVMPRPGGRGITLPESVAWMVLILVSQSAPGE